MLSRIVEEEPRLLFRNVCGGGLFVDEIPPLLLVAPGAVCNDVEDDDTPVLLQALARAPTSLLLLMLLLLPGILILLVLVDR